MESDVHNVRGRHLRLLHLSAKVRKTPARPHPVQEYDYFSMVLFSYSGSVVFRRGCLERIFIQNPSCSSTPHRRASA